MAKQLVIVLLMLLLLFISTTEVVEGTISNSSIKLFVFGDSYVDTGNFFISPSYMPPYGITFPGKPAGRFSDGRVLTDYIASYMNIKSPAPYLLRNSSELQYGINFAYGGTGVFNTLVPGPNMTIQIDKFEKLLKQNVYNKTDLQSSIALVSAVGNDYFKFLFVNGGDVKDVGVFTASLINQLSLNLKRIQSLGINKIVVELNEPLGCLPVFTQFYSYKKCNDTLNMVAMNHNQLLVQAVEKLNKEIGKSVFFTQDLYAAFLSTFESMKKNNDAMNPLQPCCVGVLFCGIIICDKPELTFFWDALHPSQNGWYGVYQMVQSSIPQIV